MLYKYGGIYLDIDLVILKDFSSLRNAVGAQSVGKDSKQWTRLNGAVMIFDINHPILVDFLEEFATTFNGNKWGHNGPYLVSRSWKHTRLQPYNLASQGILSRGLESESRAVEITLNELNEMETYAVHLWNKRSIEIAIQEGSVMARLCWNFWITGSAPL
ncbi:hypothetical protein DVH24_036116 [Malus domestica]|uniref:Alpha 1,4-glycosyltransferase domain-containing protein n=1 Tax=Malus domestica TaxID=3750 RepID=A0A498II02_MALDO|nr:hypothetical protein DVH24_036116 [Malus domestica]